MGMLIFNNGLEFEGQNFGASNSVAGEAVFSTGMMGYPESLTDPSYKGQILILTYPLIGNYGIPDPIYWESEKIQISGLIVSDYINTPYHFQSRQTLAEWLKKENIPGLIIKDTRLLTQIIRDNGSMLAKIAYPPAPGIGRWENDNDIKFYDPNVENLISKVSTREIIYQIIPNNKKTILLIDCGAKKNIQRAFLKRKVNVITVPWDFDLTLSKEFKNKIDAVVISNGPGDPTKAIETTSNVQKLIKLDIPILGICLGHQILAIANGGKTKKLKYGHRSQNQPCLMTNSNRCYITTQNHGFEVNIIPKGFNSWFINANDGSNEGIIHKSKPIMSVQFHPEATPGPEDTEWIFDYFLEKI
jgi:carbamoyl-phosphate synthase small subunit